MAGSVGNIIHYVNRKIVTVKIEIYSVLSG